MHIRWFMLFAVILSVFVISGGCTSTSSPLTQQSPSGSSQPAPAGQQPGQSAALSGTLTLSVDSLSPGGALPDVYTCKGASESPEVSWSGIPVGTKSLVLIVEDPDAPAGTFTHWLVYNIPPGSGELAQGQPVQYTAIFSVFMQSIYISPSRQQTGQLLTRPWPVIRMQRPSLPQPSSGKCSTFFMQPGS
jgi:hypothetical protein